MSKGRKPKPDQVTVDLALPRQLIARLNSHLRNPTTGRVPRERSGLIAMLLKQYLDRVERITLDDFANGEEHECEA